MANLPQIFNFDNHELRTIVEGDAIFFNASDACIILGYKGNVTNTITKHCLLGGVIKRNTPTSSGEQEMAYISEPNLYRLIIRSKMPLAEAFEKKVMEEILPAIRKTGSYIAPKQLTVADMFIQQAQAFAEQQKDIEVVKERLDVLEAQQTTHPQDYVTVTGYARLIHRKVTTKESAMIGKKCKKLCNELGFHVSTVADQKYGTVNIYPKDALEIIFNEN